MSLSTYYLYDRYLARLRCRAQAPTSNTASHDNLEKINSWVSFSFLYEYGAPLKSLNDHEISREKTLFEKKCSPLPVDFSRITELQKFACNTYSLFTSKARQCLK